MEINMAADTTGLYGTEAAKCDHDSSRESGQSDCDFDEKPSKKDGKLGGKKKEKEDKEKKKDKDKGYAALGGESSQEESEMDLKSPFKGKKRSFKFSSGRKEKKKEDDKEKKKEKEKKVRECEASPKESRDDSKSDKADKKKKEKEPKTKEIKSKLKIKDKKKVKCEELLENPLPVFGVTLELAVQRSRCHDGVDLPVVVRNCIDYIEEFGLNQEGIYRSSGVKTRVIELRRAYNQRENVVLNDTEPPTVASLLKQFLRELADNILTAELSSKFEDATCSKDSQQQEEQFANLIGQLPPFNRILLSWLMVHMEHVTERERVNKMNVQNLSIVLIPTLNLSPRVLNCLFTHGRRLFSSTKIIKYVPPLSGFGVRFPEGVPAIEVELRKQESLLAQIHAEMSVGSVAKHREEQLWEAQRIVTQLKRQLKLHVQGPASAAASPPAKVVNPQKEPDHSVIEESAPQKQEDVAENTVATTAVAPVATPVAPVATGDHVDDELKLDLAIPESNEDVKENVNADVEASVETEVAAEKASDAEAHVLRMQINNDASVTSSKSRTSSEASETSEKLRDHVTVIEIGTKEESDEQASTKTESLKIEPVHVQLTEEQELELKLKIENDEREKMINQLKEAIERETISVERLQELIAETGALQLTDSSDEDEDELVPQICEKDQEQLLAEVLRENRELEEENSLLQIQIDEVQEAVLQLRVQLRVREEKSRISALRVS